MNIDAYLKRINYSGSLEPTAETLRALQVAHLFAVPFENLSIHAGEPIVLNEDALFGKIVENRRGGFCYEANGLFASLLRALGFEVAMLSAGVATRDGGFGPDFDHMTLMVTLAERWLVDVGFGDSFLEPLLLDSRDEQVQGTRAFRIIEDNSHLILQRRDAGGDLGAAVSFHPPTPHICRLRTDVPLPPDISRIPLHQSTSLFSRNRRRPHHPDRPAPNHYLNPTTLRTPSRGPRFLRRHPPRSIWHRDEEPCAR